MKLRPRPPPPPRSHPLPLRARARATRKRYDFAVATPRACAAHNLSQACTENNLTDNCELYSSVDYVTGAPEHVFQCREYTPVVRYWYIDGFEVCACRLSYCYNNNNY